MFDFLRNLTKSDAEKQQERVSAYLDNALTPQERAAFEEQLRADTALRADLGQQRLVKQNISQLPMLRAPRNFTLDPAAYGRPAPQPAFKLYPVMRAATAIAAVMLIFLFSLELFSPANEATQRAAEAPIAQSDVAREESGGAVVAADEIAETAADSDFQGSAPAAESEIFSAPSVEGETAEEESIEEVAEPEETVTELDGALGITGGAAEEEAPQPAEPTFAPEAAAADDSYPPVVETGQPLTITQAIETVAAGGDGFTTAQGQESAPTQSIVPTATPGRNTNTELSGSSPSPTVVMHYQLDDSNTTTTPPPLRLLEIGIGVLFLILLSATWLLRRRL